MELWQSYICLHNFLIGGYTDDDIIDSYQRHFMSCNKYESFTDLCENTVLLSDDVKLTLEENITSDTNLLNYLQQISDNIFVYYARERVSNSLVWYTKIVSPDFFLHMNNSGAININNKIYHTGTVLKSENQDGTIPIRITNGYIKNGDNFSDGTNQNPFQLNMDNYVTYSVVLFPSFQ